MYASHHDAGKRRLTAGAATVAIHVVVIGGLAWGLSFRNPPPAATQETRALTIDLEEPPPPPPPPEVKQSAAAKEPAAPEAAKAEAVPREAPEVALPFPVARTAPVAGEGRESSAGAGTQGSGQGAGGEGNGTGGGGDGGGVGSPAQRIAGALRDSDYPREAERDGLAGTVRISFRVRTDGGVDRCRVVGSSGYPLLDDLTCRLFIQRYRFRPATNGRGEPIESTLQTSFTWGTRRR